jgi:hypothetical protein
MWRLAGMPACARAHAVTRGVGLTFSMNRFGALFLRRDSFCASVRGRIPNKLLALGMGLRSPTDLRISWKSSISGTATVKRVGGCRCTKHLGTARQRLRRAFCSSFS